MVKRKKARKMEAKQSKAVPAPGASKSSMPVPAIAIKALSGFLAVLMVIALTLYVLGKMPARGFWTLTIILAILAFVVIPVMRKKFVEGL